MSGRIRITRVGPLTTIQDQGRAGMLRHGVSASGPMDEMGWSIAGEPEGSASSGVEFTTTGLDFVVESGTLQAGFAGGTFLLSVNNVAQPWPGAIALKTGDSVSVKPGASGNYGYVRFGGDIDVPLMLGSRATNTVVGLGGLAGRALRVGDVLDVMNLSASAGQTPKPLVSFSNNEIRVVWGIHADLFSSAARTQFLSCEFEVSTQLDRMAVRLIDHGSVFKDETLLSLVSDCVVAGDVQVLGDGTPIVLMRDHQPTGGYPRIATVISADINRFAQMRPGTKFRFRSVSLAQAQALLRKVATP